MKRINDLIEKLWEAIRELGNRPGDDFRYYMIDKNVAMG